jgi:AraC family transcriptional regulator, exoenzyme S synthesis regulatory protein ExsA
MIPDTSATPPSNQGLRLFGKGVLLLNECPAIQTIACDPGHADCLFLEYTRLLFVRRGSCLLKYGLKQWELRRNELALLKPTISIEFRAGAGTPGLEDNEYLFFDFTSEILQHFIRLGDWKPVTGLPFSAITPDVAGKKLLAYVKSLDCYFEDPESCSDNLISVKLMELLFFLADASPALFHQLVDIKRTFRTDIRVMVEENIMNGLSLDELAALASRSVSSFRRDFRAIYNMPPSQWLRQKRMESAGKLLRNTSMSVTEICYTLGFQNVTNFCRLFKGYYGRSASEFRSNTIDQTRITHQ